MHTEEETAAALLRDVLEDTDMTLQQLADTGFSSAMVKMVRLLTHEDGMEYMDYVVRLKPNTTVRAVKLADLTHNSDTSRINGEITAEDRNRLDKYGEAKALLEQK